jgi:hypothetical protein
MAKTLFWRVSDQAEPLPQSVKWGCSTLIMEFSLLAGFAVSLIMIAEARLSFVSASADSDPPDLVGGLCC